MVAVVVAEYLSALSVVGDGIRHRVTSDGGPPGGQSHPPKMLARIFEDAARNTEDRSNGWKFLVHLMPLTQCSVAVKQCATGINNANRLSLHVKSSSSSSSSKIEKIFTVFKATGSWTNAKILF